MAGVNQKDLNLFICLPLTHFIRKECHPQSCSVPSFHFSQHVLCQIKSPEIILITN